MATQTKTNETSAPETSEVATVVHERHVSKVSLMDAKTDGMSTEDWETTRSRRFDGENHKRRALAFAVDHVEGGYDDVMIENRALKMDLRGQVEEADGPQEAANALASYLRHLDIGGDPTAEHEEDFSRVKWPSGPFEWALSFSAGDSIYSGELGRFPSKFDIYKMDNNRTYHLEPKNGQTVTFYAT